MAERENPMSVRSKNALAEALLKLMMNAPIESITISDVTFRAHLSRQTFYTNFSKKEDILSYLVRGLFLRYEQRLENVCKSPSNLLADYFFFWDQHRDFISLLFRQGQGYIFQEQNRQFFTEALPLGEILNGEDWQKPYIRSSIAGLTYELMWMWLVNDNGLSVDRLSAITANLLAGNIFKL